MEDVNEQYQTIISKCKFISKEGEWFVEGTEAELEDKCIYAEYKPGDKFNNGFSLFNGYTHEVYKGYDGPLPRPDGEICAFSEFFIFDEFGNEISEFTLDEYKEFLKNKTERNS